MNVNWQLIPTVLTKNVFKSSYGNQFIQFKALQGSKMSGKLWNIELPSISITYTSANKYDSVMTYTATAQFSNLKTFNQE